MLEALWVRLLLAFTAVLGIAVATIAIFANLTMTSEFRDYESEASAMLNERVSRIAGRVYREQGWPGVATYAQRTAEAVDLQIVVVDQQDSVVVDTERVLAGGPMPRNARIRTAPSLLIGDAAGATIGTIYLRPKGQDRAEAFLADVHRAILLGAGLGVFVAFVVSLLLARRMVAPIQQLTGAVQKLREGDLSQRVKSPGGGEVGKLSEAFNTMAVRLDLAQRLRRNMVADVAHELRTPLHNVLGYLELVRDKATEPTPDVIAAIHDEASVLKRLVDDLQQLALVESGQLQLSRRPTSVSALLQQAVAVVEPEVGSKDVDVAVEASSDLPDVWVDETRIGQVVRNLLSNAIAHTTAGGRITLSAKYLGGVAKAVEIAVADTGPGISSGDLPYVFERFYRADASRARVSGGAGLGLTIAKQLVEAHGGSMRAESEPGRGACFRLTLPTVPLPAVSAGKNVPRG
ncbi:MAG: HAMP domain-containing protein [Chloroflexi bacterium]|nr:HAMP domain-containing protein [Chloroflexota bacterium]